MKPLPTPKQTDSAPDEPRELDRLAAKRIVFVTGKGGVGKTTFCGALGLHAAATGRRVLLAEVSSAPAFGQIFGDVAVGFDPTRVGERLWAANCEPRQSLVAFLHRFVKIRRIARSLVRNRITGHFLEAAPGVLETVVLERISHLSLEGHDQLDFDLVIVDLPSTGHAITFLDCPKSLARVLQTGRLADYLHALAGRLADPALSEIVVVAQPEEMPVQETIELWRAAHERLEIPLRTVVINRIRQVDVDPALIEPLLSRGKPVHSGLNADPESLPELTAARLIATWTDRERRFIERLKGAVDARYVEIPWVAEHSTERQLLGEIAAGWSSASPRARGGAS